MVKLTDESSYSPITLAEKHSHFEAENVGIEPRPTKRRSLSTTYRLPRGILSVKPSSGISLSSKARFAPFKPVTTLSLPGVSVCPKWSRFYLHHMRLRQSWKGHKCRPKDSFPSLRRIKLICLYVSLKTASLWEFRFACMKRPLANDDVSKLFCVLQHAWRYPTIDQTLLLVAWEILRVWTTMWHLFFVRFRLTNLRSATSNVQITFRESNRELVGRLFYYLQLFVASLIIIPSAAKSLNRVWTNLSATLLSKKRRRKFCCVF